MGYDLYVCDTEGNDLPESRLNLTMDSTDDQFDAELERRHKSRTYLRRGGGTLGHLITGMVSAGMAYAAKSPPKFPDRPGKEHFDNYYDPITEEGREYHRQFAHALRTTGDERPGIPIHKFSSNDGWWVTVHECRSALAMWELEGQPQGAGFRDDFIPFLIKAAENGGFRVC